MGYELWASPVTGYRRHGTRLEDLRSLLDVGLTARSIMEPVQSCLSATPANLAAHTLNERDFDIAGVVSAAGDSPRQFVQLAKLKGGTVGQHAQMIELDQLIADGTPLGAVLQSLRVRPYAFVLAGAAVVGIITRADLNKPPVRLYLFGMISLLEMHLSFWIKSKFPDDSWQAGLSAARLLVIGKTKKVRQERKQNPFLVDCLQLCDKRDVVVADEQLRQMLLLGSRRVATTLLKKVEDLRNVLAHGQSELVDGTSWEATIVLVSRVSEVLEASDQEVERIAEAAAIRHQSTA